MPEDDYSKQQKPASQNLFMDNVAVFCSDPLSVHRVMSICDQFELASEANVNRSESEAVFLGNWADQSFLPITVRTDDPKVLGIWFRGAGCKELTLTEYCRLAHSKVQDHTLRDASKFGAAAAKAQWGKTQYLSAKCLSTQVAYPRGLQMTFKPSQFGPNRDNCYLQYPQGLRKWFSLQIPISMLAALQTQSSSTIRDPNLIFDLIKDLPDAIDHADLWRPSSTTTLVPFPTSFSAILMTVSVLPHAPAKSSNFSNTFHCTLKFTWIISDISVPFLDLSVSIS
eukprot:g44911.t1